MKNKILFIVCIFAFLFTLGGCTTIEQVEVPKEELQEYIYELAVKTGYEGAYDEWLASIKGETGKDGKKIELSTTLTHIIWRYTDETEWKELIEISELKAEDGKSAYEIAQEYGYKGTELEWLASLKGKDGAAQNSVTSADVNEKGELVLVLVDGTSINVGKVTGNDGIGIKSIKIDEDNNLIITLTDGTEFNCGKLPECDHYFGYWEYVSEPTCTSMGVRVSECYYCDVEQYEYVEALEHTYSEWTKLISTCKEYIRKRTCEVCFNTEFQTLDPITTDHIYVDGKCKDCGKFKDTFGLEFELLDNGTYQLVGLGSCVERIVIIPEIYNGTLVTSIGGSVFDSNTVATVVIPYTIKDIASDAFKNATNLYKVCYTGSLNDWNQIIFGNEFADPRCQTSTIYLLNEHDEWYEVK